jgi:TRAP-type C4-dicarboxylate transport system substrate-binding protein
MAIAAAVVLLLSVVAGCAPGAGPSETFELKVSQAMMATTSITHQDMVEWGEAITDRTDGKVTWTYFGPEIGDWTELQRMVTEGAVDAQINAFDTSLDPRWNAFYLPFLVSSWDGAREVFGPGGIFDELGKEWAEKSNVYYLGSWLNNLASFGFRFDKPITNSADAKGVKIRCFPMDIGKCYVEKMGFTSITLTWAEAPTAIATGVADGWIGSGAVYWYDLFRDIAKSASLTYECCETWAMTMNLDRWNSLPEEYQEIIQEESTKMIIKHLGQVEEEEIYYQEKLIDEYGWTIVDMAKEHPEDLQEWKDSARECWELFEPVIGKQYVDRIRAATG